MDDLQPINAENIQQLKLLQRFGDGRTTDVSWSKDGKWIAMATARGVRILNPDTLDTVQVFPLTYAGAVSFSQEANLLAVAWYKDEDKIRPKLTILDVETGKGILDLDTSGLVFISSVHFDPTGKLLLCTSFYRGVRIYDTATGELVFDKKVETVASASITPDLKRLLTVGYDGKLTEFDLSSQTISWETQISRQELDAVAVAPDGSLAAAGDIDGTIYLINLSDRSFHPLEPKHDARVDTLEWSPTGSMLASSSFDGKIALWDLQTRSLIRTLEPGKRSVSGMDFSPQGDRLVTVSLNGSAQIWNTEDGGLIQERPGGLTYPGTATISKDGNLIATGDFNGLVTVWDLQAGALKWEFDDQSTHISSLAFSPDGRYLASATDIRTYSNYNAYIVRNKPVDQVVVWDLETGDPVYANWSIFLGVLFTPDGKALLACANSTDRSLTAHTVGAWDESPYTVKIHRQNCQSRMAFSPNGTRLATYFSLEVFPTERGDRVYDVGMSFGPAGNSFDGAVFSPDGKMVAHAGDLLWVCYANGPGTPRPPTPKCNGKRMVFAADIEAGSVSFSPDSRLLFVGHTNRKISFFSADEGNELGEIEVGMPGVQRAPAVWSDGNQKRLIIVTGDGILEFWGVHP